MKSRNIYLIRLLVIAGEIENIRENIEIDSEEDINTDTLHSSLESMGRVYDKENKRIQQILELYANIDHEITIDHEFLIKILILLQRSQEQKITSPAIITIKGVSKLSSSHK